MKQQTVFTQVNMTMCMCMCMCCCSLQGPEGDVGNVGAVNRRARRLP